MRMVYRRVFFVLFMVIPLLGVGAIDIEFTAPTVQFDGAFKQFTDSIGFDTSNITSMVQENMDLLEQEVEENEEINRYSNPSLLPLGFANASAAASHAGTQRSFIDYSLFAVSVGAGIGASAPTIDPNKMAEIGDEIQRKGDLYAGLAAQPLVASVGLNLSPLVKGLRVNGKFGMLNIPPMEETYDLTSESFIVGFGAQYQLIQSFSLPLGFIRWRGISIGSGFIYQKNNISLAMTIEEQKTDPITLGQLGFNQFVLDGYNIVNPTAPPLKTDSDFGYLSVIPSFDFSFETKTYTIPIEVNTGLRILYLLDVNFGAGVDLAFGSSTLNAGVDAEVNFKGGSEMAQYIATTPGSASLEIALEKNPQFFRPRITTGVMLNLGPLRLDIPVMLYFDSEGNSAVVGVNLALVW